jgi:hypothetical protein
VPFEQKAQCRLNQVTVETTRKDLDWITYWKRVRLIDWKARVDVGNVQHDRWIRCQDIAWRVHVAVPDDMHVGFRIVIDRDADTNISDADYHAYMQQLCKWLATTPHLATWLQEGEQQRLVLVDSAGAYDVRRGSAL